MAQQYLLASIFFKSGLVAYYDINSKYRWFFSIVLVVRVQAQVKTVISYTDFQEKKAKPKLASIFHYLYLS